MDEKVCLDTDLCMEIIKGNLNFVELLTQNKEAYVTSITVFELLLRETNIDKIESFLNDVYIIDFNERCAKIATRLYKELKKLGKMLDLKDLFIAATCIANNCKLATLNKKHFSRIKNLKLI